MTERITPDDRPSARSVSALAAATHVPGAAAAATHVPGTGSAAGVRPESAAEQGDGGRPGLAHGAGHRHGPDTTHVVPAAHRLVRVEVTETPLDMTEHETLVAHASAGAVVSFAGIVRDHDGGRHVRELEYVAHPSAGAVLEQIAAEFAAMEYVEAIAVSHRVGHLAIGETALACAVSTAHRAQAFALCAHLVDEVKARLPIWKRQVFADGHEEWVDCP